MPFRPANDDRASAGGPLAGIRILELGLMLAGPFAGRLLGDLGAEVIKVEPPDRPDPLRDWGHGQLEGHSLWWPVQSRNKQLVTLNLRSERGRELCLELVARSDAVIENFRPGTLERLGLGFEELRQANPGIVLARVSGYGQSGPYADRAGFAAVAEAMGGLRAINGFPDRPPPRLGISIGDSLAGMFAAQGILAALYQRDALGGEGQVVDVSLMESCFALLESAVPEYDLLGLVRGPAGTGLRGVVPSNIFVAKDGQQLVIAANQDAVFRRLCEAMEQPQLADDPRFVTHLARAEHREECEMLVAEWVAGHDGGEVDRLLNEAGVVCGPIYTVADIVADPHYRAREMLVEHVDPELGPYLGPGVVPKFTETPGAVRWSAHWQLGSHNREVYCGLLGLPEEELETLAAEGVL